jgi:nitronate monooxygenase
MDWPQNALTERLDLKAPILQAPMGGAATPALAAAVSAGGGLGGLGFGASSIDSMRDAIRSARLLGAERINANFFIHTQPVRNPDKEQEAIASVASLAERLGLDQPQRVSTPFEPFGSSMLEAVLDAAPDVVSFHFDAPDRKVVSDLHRAGILVGGTATTVSEAVALQEHDCDFVVAQGEEAGGHRGTFSTTAPRPAVGTLALVPQVVDAVAIPVYAAGGIADGRGLAAALVLGAAGVQVGTAFLSCPEASVSADHRQAMAAGASEDTCTTSAFSGRPARAFRNSVTDCLPDATTTIADYPIQFSVTQAVRSAKDPSLPTEAMWAGQAFPLAIEESALSLVARIVAEAEQLLPRSSR